MTHAELMNVLTLVPGYRPHVEVPPPLPISDISETAALLAIDRVTARFPGARFVTEGDFGRVIAGDRLVSLAFSVSDPDVELLCWIDSAGRLGDGNCRV